MVLIRFSDAVRELAGHPGAQVYRSHWVTASQAWQILHEKKRTMVELVDGRRLPVSRPYFRDAKKWVGGKQYAGNHLYRAQQSNSGSHFIPSGALAETT